MGQFRFQELLVWQKAADFALVGFDIGEFLEGERKYRYAEQFRAASLSISNNIAEGSGSSSDKDFAHFLNIARRSVFECANMIFLFTRNKLLNENQKTKHLLQLEEISKMLTSLRKSLLATG